MTPDQLRNAFVADFQELLRRYNADFGLGSHWRDFYPEDVPYIYFRGEYDADGNATREWSEFFLNDYV